MKTSTATVVVFLLLAFIVAGWWYYRANPPLQTPPAATAPVASVVFACDAGRSIQADFFEASSTPPAAEGQPPTPGGSVALTLSDGRTLTLPQTISGSGIRYANADETFVFWGKGNTAFVTEGPQDEQTYRGCILVAPDASSTLTQIYATSTLGFSVRFPAGYTADPSYRYTGLGAGKSIEGVRFTVPEASVQGTNLSADTYVSVEVLPGAQECTASEFLSGNPAARSFTDAGVTYSVATSTGAAAGNRYDEAVFSIPGSSPCTAVRYFVHSTVLGNYPEGTVVAYNAQTLLDAFDAIRRTLVLGR